jgi:adenylosuccinate synthase
MVLSPEGLLNEADGLRYTGITNAFELLTIDERAICATPYHGIASRLKEISRGMNPRGTIGTGVGETYRDRLKYPDLVIRAGELRDDLRAKLSRIRDYQVSALKSVINGEFLNDDLDTVAEEVTLLTDDGFLDHVVDRFREVGRVANIVSPDYLRELLSEDGTAVVESSHGILTDSEYGFQPHVSAIRTLPKFAQAMLAAAGYDGEIVNVGVHRAYTIRHGAGPMPTADPKMNDNLLPGSHKEENRYQGKVRVGPLDLVLLKYAIDVCGPGAIDWLAVSWFDQINCAWYICDDYSTRDPKFFTTGGRIKVFDGNPEDMPDYQQKLCSALFECKPEIFAIGDLPESQEDRYRLCDRQLRDKLGIPVRLVSFGPTDRDKVFEEKS